MNKKVIHSQNSKWIFVSGTCGRYEVMQMMRWIPPGNFLMGSPPGELGRFDDEGPQHRVTISQGFWLADTACTQELWLAVMGENPSFFNKDMGGGSAHPVENVSWFMVQEFLQKLNAQLPGFNFTLPTEAEWEYVCRAGTTTPFSFGDTISTDQANYHGNYPYGKGKKGQYRECTVPVKALPANAWWLYQMHGNVWEWCADHLRVYSQDAQDDPGLDEGSRGRGGARALRGGSLLNGARFARSACRNGGVPDGQCENVGFRLAMRSSSSDLQAEGQILHGGAL